MNLYLLTIGLALLLHGKAELLLWPQPSSLQTNPKSQPVEVSPCKVNYVIKSPIAQSVSFMLNHYLDNIFKCTDKTSSNYTLTIVVHSNNKTLPTQTAPQAYSLILRTSGRWQLEADYYSGFLRGLQTYSQLFIQQKEGIYTIEEMPIVIDDRPEFKWRGIMIDTSRHFMPVSVIKQTIDALMYNKMNILHWHIIDQDSFPMQVPTVPQLNAYGKIGGSFTPEQVQLVLDYAKARGVRVVVEIDTPAHTHSWGRSPKYQQTVVRCNSVFTGQFDPTLNLTYDLVWKVMNHVNKTFDDPFIHFGGDEVSPTCWDLKPSIKVWMQARNISTYKQLEILYRKTQKNIWKTISQNKRVIYWANEDIDLPLEPDDVLQWWGVSKNSGRLVGRVNEVILSYNDLLYLDKGFGNRNGIPYGQYIKWRDMYALNPRIEGVKVIGAEACMWSELSSKYTHQQKIWIRASVLAERLWNDKIDISHDLAYITRRLVAHAKRMTSRGYKVSPVTVELCEQDVSVCFP